MQVGTRVKVIPSVDLPESLWDSEATVKYVGCIGETTLYIVPDRPYPESGGADGGWYVEPEYVVPVRRGFEFL